MRKALLAAAAVVAVLSGCGGSKALKPASSLPVVVLDSPSAAGWVRLLRASGWSAHDGDLASVYERTAAVVPADATLSTDDAKKLAKWVSDGGRVATANAALLLALGIGQGERASLQGSGDATWARLWDVAPLEEHGLKVLARGRPGDVALLGEKRRGAGLALAFAVDPVGDGRSGWELLPDAATVVGRELGAPVGPRAVGVHMFIDPGGLPEGVKTDYARVADMAARSGTRVAEIAAWNYDFNDASNDYDYGKLIDALHRRGILAYAWLEPPFVTLRLYQDHPECRERTMSGRDAFVDWRSLIALEDPDCMLLAKQSWARILTRFPWDGVNVAELYFEPPTLGPDKFTPFSRAALEQFGDNPHTQRAAFMDWRTRTVTQLNDQVLRFVSGLPRAKSRALELTVIDDRLDPTLGRGVGSDVQALSEVAARAGATLVVEDPVTTWADGPFRYDELGPHVLTIFPAWAALLDVNVVNRGPARPTPKARGAELALTVQAAAASFGKVAMYALGTLTPKDIDAIPGALGGETSTTDIGVFGKWTVTVTAPEPTMGRLVVDQVPWPAVRGHAVVPAGNHELTWSDGAPIGPGLSSFTGQLGTARVSKHRLEFTYDSRTDCFAIVDEKPTSLEIDEKPAALGVVADPAGGWVVRLPGGTRKAVLEF